MEQQQWMDLLITYKLDHLSCTLLGKLNFTKEEKDAQIWLKNNREPTDEVLKRWEKSYPIRKDFREKDAKIAGFLEEWPILLGKIAPELVKWDFKQMFDVPDCDLENTFSNFFEDILRLRNKTLSGSDNTILQLLKNGVDLTTDSKAAIQIFLLPALVPPKGRKVLSDQKSWKPSITEARDGLMVHVKIPGDMKKAKAEQITSMRQNMNSPGCRSTIAVPKQIGNSNIPLRRQLSRQSSSPNVAVTRTSLSDPAHRWKQKYEESEEKRKILLSEKEKALRSLKDLDKKHLNLQVKHEHLETELFEKNEEFSKLSTASKNLYKEYETLKNQYETETGAMARALKDASQWYKENKELKRKTFLLPDKDAVDEGVDTGENGGDADIENLNKTIRQLSAEVAELQTELDSLRQSEFHVQEQNVKISEELELQKKNNKELRSELDKLQLDHQQLIRVCDVMKKEMEKLKEVEEQQRTSLEEMRKEAAGCRKERNVLAHQSTLLLQGLNEENATESLFLLQEIEKLKATIEDERNRYEEEIIQLQEKLEDKEENSHVEIMEERLKLVEAELQAAIARAEEAEAKLKAPPLPPPPPPPPPAPPLPMTDPSVRPVVPLRRRKSRATVQELAETIGVQETVCEAKPAPPGVNNDIINAIKEGKFTLKKAKKDKDASGKEKEAPKAVSELLNILGSLRRAPKKRQSLVTNKNDVVQL